MRLLLLTALFFMFAPFNADAQVSSDTIINSMDSGCTRRKGYYKIYGRMIRDTSYRPEELVEEGMYQDGYKVGEWITYYPGGQIKMRMVYEVPVAAARDKKEKKQFRKRRRVHLYW